MRESETRVANVLYRIGRTGGVSACKGPKIGEVRTS